MLYFLLMKILLFLHKNKDAFQKKGLPKMDNPLTLGKFN